MKSSDGLKPLYIFIAGPYRNTDPQKCIENVKRTMEIAKTIIKMGHYPIEYHGICHYFKDDFSIDYNEYINVTTNLLIRCDAIFFIDHSAGADIELQKAKELGLKIFKSLSEIPKGNSNDSIRIDIELAKFSLQELGQNMRYFLADRFQIFSVALLINGALLATFQYEFFSKIRIYLICFALLISIFCLIFDRSSRSYYKNYLSKAISIQNKTDILIYSVDKRPFYKRSTPFVIVFYLSMSILWIVFLVQLIFFK